MGGAFRDALWIGVYYRNTEGFPSCLLPELRVLLVERGVERAQLPILLQQGVQVRLGEPGWQRTRAEWHSSAHHENTAYVSAHR